MGEMLQSYQASPPFFSFNWPKRKLFQRSDIHGVQRMNPAHFSVILCLFLQCRPEIHYVFFSETCHGTIGWIVAKFGADIHPIQDKLRWLNWFLNSPFAPSCKQLYEHVHKNRSLSKTLGRLYFTWVFPFEAILYLCSITVIWRYITCFVFIWQL